MANNTLPNANEEYGSIKYWNQRYTDEESYDWLLSYDAIKYALISQIKPEHRILMLGCGNSTLSEEMYRDGYTNIVNIDVSSVVIEKMRTRHQDCNGMSWLVMDAAKLAFEDDAFDVVIEKATLDVMLVKEKDPWFISRATANKLQRVLLEVSRVLKSGGCFFSITFAQPHFRGPLYAQLRYKWSVRHNTYGESFHYFVYVMMKGQELDDSYKKYEVRQLHDEVEKALEPDCEDFLLSITI